ncbi:unnamed protein product [Alopecurus aequalis]
MKAGSATSRKRKSDALESTYEAPAPVAIEATGPPTAGEDDEGLSGGADRLSSLPDAILGEIISLLATKEGARTRILASRWHDLWLSAPLNLDCREIAGCWKSVCSDVLSRILLSHHGPGRRLYVSIYALNVPEDFMEVCLRSSALDNLEELDFIDRFLKQPQLQRALIFRFSHTLRVANISSCDLSNITFEGLHFPLLKQLGLVMVTMPECSLHTLIAGCSALECLLIYKIIGVRCLRINSFTIRSVSMLLNHGDMGYMGLIRLEQVVIENAPCLLRLHVLGPQDKLHVSVVAAPKLETLGFIGDRCNAGERSTLEFGSTVIQDLRVDKLITEVYTVKILALDMRNLCLDTVIELMRCFPCLGKLYIQSHKPGPGNLWRRKHQNLIKCLDLRLKTVVLADYQGFKSQVNFVTFFALNVNLLESVTLGIRDKNNNEQFLAEQRMKLQIENWASKDVRLHFTTDRCIRHFYYERDVRGYGLADPFAHI